MNGDISKLFRYIKAHGQQPGRQLFCLPSALASFTSFALRLAFGVVQGCRSSPEQTQAIINGFDDCSNYGTLFENFVFIISSYPSSSVIFFYIQVFGSGSVFVGARG